MRDRETHTEEMDNIKITDASDREREGGEDLIVTILRAVKEEGSITKGIVGRGS